ncbi:MAG: hypothetical protein MPW17_16690 [Candidatus Manganitrophus sp.]|nr:hypothetical protein [Candidatus Manganitrophus sp.]WDT70379.1 MAG: hypothetical protein MPW17_16690 [Candidatus Manganitrophus sp.]
MEKIKMKRGLSGVFPRANAPSFWVMRNPIETRFIVDTNVGHLVRKLRMLGYDTLFINPVDDADLVQTADREERVVISGDRRLFDRKLIRSGRVKGVLIDTDQDHHTQLQLIVRTFGCGDGGSFIRCLECNTLFLSKSKEAARERVPPYVYETIAQYAYCPHCDQFFWEGEHVKRMRALIEKLKNESAPPA